MGHDSPAARRVTSGAEVLQVRPSVKVAGGKILLVRCRQGRRRYL